MDKIYKCVNVLFKYNGYEIVPYDILLEKYHKVGIAEICEQSDVIYRKIKLSANWYKNDFFNMILINKESNNPEIVCVRKFNRYFYVENDILYSIDKLDLTKYEAAYVFFKNMSSNDIQKLGVKYFYWFCSKIINKFEIIKIIFFNLLEIFMSIGFSVLYLYVFNLLDVSDELKNILFLGIFMINVSSIKSISSLIKELCVQNIVNSIELKIFIPMISLLFNLPIKIFNNYNHSDLIKRTLYVSEWARTMVTNFIVLALSIINAFLYMLIFILYDINFSLFCGVVGIIYWGILFMLGKKQYQYDEEIFEMKSYLTSKLYEYFMGIECIKLNRIEEKIVKNMERIFSRFKRKESEKKLLIGIFESSNIYLINLFSMCFFYYITKHRSISFENYMWLDCLFAAYLIQIFSIIKAISTYYEWKPIVERSKFFLSNYEEKKSVSMRRDVNGKITFDNVSFSFSPQRVIFNGVSFEIFPGDFVGIVGENGVGKSTIINMILGYITPQKGKVCIDGISLTKINISNWRRNIGVVLQDDHLVAGSIYDNIVIMEENNSDETDKKLKEIIKIVCLDKEIEKMPMGMRTILTDSKNILSAGQIQKILIARALFNDPKVLILDETTSAMDCYTQECILKNIANKNFTKILVSHRIDSLKYCNKIIRLDAQNGIQIESYTQMLDSYNQMYNSKKGNIGML